MTIPCHILSQALASITAGIMKKSNLGLMDCLQNTEHPLFAVSSQGGSVGVYTDEVRRSRGSVCQTKLYDLNRSVLERICTKGLCAPAYVYEGFAG